MRRAVHAEWTKLRTVAGPRWLLAGMVAVTVALSAAAASVSTCVSPGCGGDPVELSLTGVDLGQALVAILAVLVIGGEYGSGIFGVTLTAVPRRRVVLAAKAAVVSGVVAVAGSVAVLGSLLAGRVVLPGGQLVLWPVGGPTLRAAAGSVVYLVLVALLAFGVAAVVRDSATGVGIVLGLLYLVPIIAQVVGDPGVRRVLQQVAPMSAGLAVQATTGLDQLPIGPWAGLAVTAAWAAAALLAAAVRVGVRDD
ncbi:ABC transporter permease [Phytomonospora sp. NPDC050363]|uniref:ABC transporter permease n=1 Tax=Phytomonospora sp. NPDC050363 TaxID=3155642 RepID=UPI0033FEBB52